LSRRLKLSSNNVNWNSCIHPSRYSPSRLYDLAPCLVYNVKTVLKHSSVQICSQVNNTEEINSTAVLNKAFAFSFTIIKMENRSIEQFLQHKSTISHVTYLTVNVEEALIKCVQLCYNHFSPSSTLQDVSF